MESVQRSVRIPGRDDQYFGHDGARIRSEQDTEKMSGNDGRCRSTSYISAEHFLGPEMAAMRGSIRKRETGRAILNLQCPGCVGHRRDACAVPLRIGLLCSCNLSVWWCWSWWRLARQREMDEWMEVYALMFRNGCRLWNRQFFNHPFYNVSDVRWEYHHLLIWNLQHAWLHVWDCKLKQVQYPFNFKNIAMARWQFQMGLSNYNTYRRHGDHVHTATKLAWTPFQCCNKVRVQ